mmetsp:Transcript_12689/g.50713  ORF Transcript_12689/g.50713 Transcript_12689/m.50713 type:complete len:219 (+) Transcript_12689:1489-2145(+)
MLRLWHCGRGYCGCHGRRMDQRETRETQPSADVHFPQRRGRQGGRERERERWRDATDVRRCRGVQSATDGTSRPPATAPEQSAIHAHSGGGHSLWRRRGTHSGRGPARHGQDGRRGADCQPPLPQLSRPASFARHALQPSPEPDLREAGRARRRPAPHASSRPWRTAPRHHGELQQGRKGRPHARAQAHSPRPSVSPRTFPGRQRGRGLHLPDCRTLL